MWQKQIAPL